MGQHDEGKGRHAGASLILKILASPNKEFTATTTTTGNNNNNYETMDNRAATFSKEE
jgi:hypothetical protein